MPLGIFDANLAQALAYAVAKANAALQRRIAAQAGATIWDYAQLVRSCGAPEWTDRRLSALARITIPAKNQPALAQHIVRSLCGVRCKPAKCLVLDLDKTLSGTVTGDDGIDGFSWEMTTPATYLSRSSALSSMSRTGAFS